MDLGEITLAKSTTETTCPRTMGPTDAVSRTNTSFG